MNKIVKYILGFLGILLVIYLSLNIQNLEDYRANDTIKLFDATEYAEDFWENSLPQSIEKSIDIAILLESIKENPQHAFEEYGHKLGISSTWYFMVKGKGTIQSIENEFLVISVDENMKVRIATDFIFGNAVRDGSGKVDISEFLNMTDFNNVSVIINKMVKEKIVAPLKAAAAPGKEIEFAGAIEIQEEQINLDSLRIIPVMANIIDGTTN
jgi:predicted lipoprotein